MRLPAVAALVTSGSRRDQRQRRTAVLTRGKNVQRRTGFIFALRLHQLLRPARRRRQQQPGSTGQSTTQFSQAESPHPLFSSVSRTQTTARLHIYSENSNVGRLSVLIRFNRAIPRATIRRRGILPP